MFKEIRKAARKVSARRFGAASGLSGSSPFSIAAISGESTVQRASQGAGRIGEKASGRPA